jgi:oxygen-dependent protoporphyrinogen oxidase
MRIAIIGGGVAGLTAAWELGRAAPEGADVDVALFEASGRLGGIIETVREGGFVMETGPDGWLTAKPWASELAHDLGLGDDLIGSNDETRKTWIYLAHPGASAHPPALVPMPDGMTLMVPGNLEALQGSPLFSSEAVAAYRAEPGRAEELLASIPAEDESVASFTLRHFGAEVLYRVAAPLLSGVFGGDVHTLSARAALPALIQMERTHGSLITALQLQQAAARTLTGSIFTTLRGGVGSLIDRLTAQIPASWLRRNTTVLALAPSSTESDRWLVTHSFAGRSTTESFDRILLALPAEPAGRLIAPLDPVAAGLLPQQSSSAVLVVLAFAEATVVPVPPGFGLLVPPSSDTPFTFRDGAPSSATSGSHTPSMLQACTFVDQKFAHRVPPGARLLRGFFGGAAAARLASCNNDEIAAIARLEIARILHTHTHPESRLNGPSPAPLPDPLISIVRRLPASLPQYAIGHLERAATFQDRLAERLPGIRLIGNALHGLGIPDVIRESRQTARAILANPVPVAAH